MRPNFIPSWFFLLALAALGALLPGCGKNSSPSTPAPSSSSSVPTYRFGYFFGPGEMTAPMGVGISGNLIWVTSESSSSLQAWGPSQNFIESITSYGSPVTTMAATSQIAVGPDGYLYMMDGGNSQVAVFSPEGVLQASFGRAQMSGDNGCGVAVNGAYAYVTDQTKATAYRYTIAGSGPSKTFTASATFGNTGAVSLAYPFDLALDAAGNVIVGDLTTQRMVKYDPNGVYQSAITVSATHLNGPLGVAVDSQGNLYAAMNLEPDVKMYDPSGNLLETIGSGDVTAPTGLAFDASGDLYVTDSVFNSHQVVVFMKN